MTKTAFQLKTANSKLKTIFMAYDYDVIVIGGGAAGLTASGMAANLAQKPSCWSGIA